MAMPGTQPQTHTDANGNVYHLIDNQWVLQAPQQAAPPPPPPAAPAPPQMPAMPAMPQMMPGAMPAAPPPASVQPQYAPAQPQPQYAQPGMPMPQMPGMPGIPAGATVGQVLMGQVGGGALGQINMIDVSLSVYRKLDPNLEYEAVITKASMEKSNQNQNDMIKLEMTVTFPEHFKGVKLWDQVVLTPTSLWKFKALCAATEKLSPDGAIFTGQSEKDFEGEVIRFSIFNDTYTDNAGVTKPQNKINGGYTKAYETPGLVGVAPQAGVAPGMPGMPAAAQYAAPAAMVPGGVPGYPQVPNGQVPLAGPMTPAPGAPLPPSMVPGVPQFPAPPGAPAMPAG